MKKKFFYGILFSAILAINLISVYKSDISDSSLMSLTQIAQADASEGSCHGGDCANNKDTGYVGSTATCCSKTSSFIGNEP